MMNSGYGSYGGDIRPGRLGVIRLVQRAAVSAAIPLLLLGAASAPAIAQTSGPCSAGSACLNVDSTTPGVTDSNVYLLPHQRFAVAYKGGRWAVGGGGLYETNGNGYDVGTDSRIWPAGDCRINDNVTYGTLLGQVSGRQYVFANGGVFEAPETGGLVSAQINDLTRCRVDNHGSIMIEIKPL
jgi:hypothetical protein